MKITIPGEGLTPITRTLQGIKVGCRDIPLETTELEALAQLLTGPPPKPKLDAFIVTLNQDGTKWVSEPANTIAFKRLESSLLSSSNAGFEVLYNGQPVKWTNYRNYACIARMYLTTDTTYTLSPVP